MENNKTPSIRFKGFTDPWEQRKVKEICSISTGKSNTQDRVDEGIYPFYVRSPIVERSNRYLFDEEAVLTVGDGVGTGKVFHYVNGKYDLHQRVYRMFDFSSEINAKYFYYYFSDHFYNRVMSMTAKTSVDSVRYEMIADMDILLPKLNEQIAISNCFDNLDNLITLHQRKYDKLLNIKKSMLEKMFPKNGSNIPEIRFKGFTDPWEQRKFTDITFLSGEKNKDNLPYESYSVTNENGFVPQNEQFENGGTMATADKKMYYIVSKNSFAYNPARINVGSIGYYDGQENVIVSSLYEVFKTSEDIDDRYLWHWFKSNNFKKLIEQYQEGGVRLYFYYDKLCMCSLPTPSIQEQIKIGRYFDNLDNLITLHQRELEKLQNIKKSMLEKMFV